MVNEDLLHLALSVSSMYMTHKTIQGIEYSTTESIHRQAFNEGFLRVSKSRCADNRTLEIFPACQNNCHKVFSHIHNFFLYVFNFILPIKLQFIYSLKNGSRFSTLLYLFSFTFFILILILDVFSPYASHMKAGLTVLLLSFLPISGVFYIPNMKYSPITDHWTYSMIPALCFLLFLAIDSSTNKQRSTLKRYFLAGIFSSFPLFLYLTPRYSTITRKCF